MTDIKLTDDYIPKGKDKFIVLFIIHTYHKNILNANQNNK